jgi:folate-binding protein YgfZ
MFGRDPLKMIQGLVTNDVAGAPDNQAVYAALLTPKGRMVTDMRVFKRPDDILIELPRTAVDTTLATLKKFVPPLFARYELTDLQALGIYGPDAHAVLIRSDIATPPEDAPSNTFTITQHDDARPITIRSNYLGNVATGYEVISTPSVLRALRASARENAVTAMSETTLETLRIEAGTPRWGRDLDDATIPLEAGLRARAISETKGCYTGQEVIIRILHRGHVNRHLRGLRLGAAPRPDAGTPLFRADDGKQVGTITSAAASPRYHEGIALGYVRREVEPPATVRLGAVAGPDVTVVTLPFEDPAAP